MHPDVIEAGPGACPFCGMALEPMVASGEEDTSELRRMSLRFWACLFLGIPVMAVAMGGMFSGAKMASPVAAWIELILATPVVLWGGWPFFQRGWRSIAMLRFNMFTLISMGTGVAYGYSLIAVLAPGLFPASFNEGGHPAIYFESATAITVLVLLGQLIELRARQKTGSAIRELLSLAPGSAHVERNGAEAEVPLAEVKAGDILRVRPGERVPVDGVIVGGQRLRLVVVRQDRFGCEPTASGPKPCWPELWTWSLGPSAVARRSSA